MGTRPPQIYEDAEMPDGVELYDFEDAGAHRNLIYRDAQETLQKQFPRVHNGVRMELKDLHYADPEDYSIKQQKEALLGDKYLARRLRGTLELYNDKTGDLLDSKTTTLMRVPYLTERHTIIRDGNEWSSIAQARLLPGAYTRIQANGEPETQFNVRPGTGMPFRVHMDPESAIFRMAVRGSDLSLYSLMRDIGISDDELRSKWGDDVFEANAKKYDSRTLDKAYVKIVPEWDRKANPGRTREEKAELIRGALNRSQAATKVLRYTLPGLDEYRKSSSDSLENLVAAIGRPKSASSKPVADFELDDDGEEYRTIGPEGVLASTEKILAVNRGLVAPDVRDSLQFKKVNRLHRLLQERIKMDAGKVIRGTMYKASYRKSLQGLPPIPFDSFVEGQLIGNPLTSPLEEINPMQLVEQARRITQMGPGGLGSSRSITEDAQAVHPSQYGFISTIESPESEKAGIDTRVTWGAKLGSNGRIYQKYLERKTGKYKWLSPEDLAGRVVKIPD